MNNNSVKNLKVTKNLTNLAKKFCEFPPRSFIISSFVGQKRKQFTKFLVDLTAQGNSSVNNCHIVYFGIVLCTMNCNNVNSNSINSNNVTYYGSFLIPPMRHFI